MMFEGFFRITIVSLGRLGFLNLSLFQKKVKKEHASNNKKPVVKREKKEPKSEEKKRELVAWEQGNSNVSSLLSLTIVLKILRSDYISKQSQNRIRILKC